MAAEIERCRILCFIPVKNCQQTLAAVLSGFSEDVLPFFEEILVVDNASSDQTVARARVELAALKGVRCTVLQNTRNFGLGGSHKIAFNYAFENGFDYLVVLHGDDSVSIRDLLPVLRNHKYLEADAFLGSRFLRGSSRSSYPAHRVFFNRIVDLTATLLTFRKVSDFTGSALSCYRVSSYINKFENPIKRYSNDVSFPQFLTLYGIFRRHRIRRFPVSHRERDVKPADKLVSQFGKAILLLLRFFISPSRTIDHDVFGTFFGHTFRRIRIEGVPAAPAPTEAAPNPAVAPTPTAAELRKLYKAPVVEAPSTEEPAAKDGFEFIDLRKLKLHDPYPKIIDASSVSDLEISDLKDEHFLSVRGKLDVELICSRALRPAFLQLFKIYSPERIHLELNADRVLRSKQFYDFLRFLNDQGVSTGVVSMNPASRELWQRLALHSRNITLNYEFGANSREDFVTLLNDLSGSPAKVGVNILTHRQHFYHCFGLYDQLRALGSQTSLILQPYLSAEGDKKADDHLDLLRSSGASETNGSAILREHFRFNPEVTTASGALFQDAKEYGFIRMEPSEGYHLKSIDFDPRGKISLRSHQESVHIGNLYEGTSGWSTRLVSSTQERHVHEKI